jgi:hypothetical protein
VRAALGVQAFVGDAEPLDRFAIDKVLAHNLFSIFRLHATVPDCFGIDHNSRSVFALVQAAGLVDAHPAGQTGILGELIEARVQLALAVGGAGRAGRIRGASVVADENVAFKQGQRGSPQGAEWFFFKSKALPAALRDGNIKGPGRDSFHNSAPQPGPICENDALTMTADNLLSLKDDMVAFIEGHGLRRLPGYVTEDIPSILWEGQGNPDSWKDFVEMAKHVGAAFVTFSEMTLDREELDALIEQANEMNFPDEEAAELVEAKWLRKYAGMVGYIQLGFVHQGLAFLHETTTEWYERFQALVEDLESFQDIVIDDSEAGDDEDE